MKIDPEFKMLCKLRSQVSSQIRKYKGKKCNSTVKLLGCSIKNFKKHMELQFKNGMTWENYGKWHIDHIKPCSLFDLTKPEDQRKCFHYTNLQPLWAKDNIVKGNKFYYT